MTFYFRVNSNNKSLTDAQSIITLSASLTSGAFRGLNTADSNEQNESWNENDERPRPSSVPTKYTSNLNERNSFLLKIPSKASALNTKISPRGAIVASELASSNLLSKRVQENSSDALLFSKLISESSRQKHEVELDDTEIQQCSSALASLHINKAASILRPATSSAANVIISSPRKYAVKPLPSSIGMEQFDWESLSKSSDPSMVLSPRHNPDSSKQPSSSLLFVLHDNPQLGSSVASHINIPGNKMEFMLETKDENGLTFFILAKIVYR
jgi:hypothetical protein